jgi:hypothetical protein
VTGLLKNREAPESSFVMFPMSSFFFIFQKAPE